MLFTELHNFAAFKNYCILKFGNLVGFLIKKDAEIEFSDVLRIFELLLHLESNLAEMWKIASIHKGKKSGAVFWKILSTFDFMPILHEKISKNDKFWWFSGNFSCKIGLKSKVDNIFQRNASNFGPRVYPMGSMVIALVR